MEVSCSFQDKDFLRSVFVAYVLDGSPQFAQLPAETRTRISFMLELYCRGHLFREQLFRVTQCLFEGFTDAVTLVITFAEQPQLISPLLENAGPNAPWGHVETLFLLSAYVFGGFLMDTLEFSLRHRTATSRQRRLQRVVDSLLSRGLISLPTQKKTAATQTEKPLLQHQQPVVRQRLVAQMRQAVATRQRFARLRSQIALGERRIKKLEQELFMIQRDREVTMDEDDEADQGDDLHIGALVLREFVDMIAIPPKQRTYSKLLLDIGQLVHLTSPKAYRLLRQIVPLPCPSSLWNHFSRDFSSLKCLLMNDGQIVPRVKQIIDGAHDSSPVIFTVGVDAFAFSSFSAAGPVNANGRKDEFNNAFLFVSIPLNACCPVQAIHIEPSTKGCFDSHIIELIDATVKAYRDNSAQVWFIATDGDRYLSSRHDSFYEMHVSPQEDDFFGLLDTLYNYVQSGCAIPVADPLHFGKNFRGKLLDYNIAVVENGSSTHQTNAAEIETCLKLGAPLTDVSHLGRMRDYYVTALFTLKNVCTLLTQRLFHASLALLPYSCVYTVLYCSNLSTTSRVFLIHLAYLGYQRLSQEAKKLVEAKSGVKWRGGNQARGITIAEMSFFRRMMHTCLGLGLALRRGPNYVRLDSIGTHLVENSIGIARSTSNSPDFGRIVSAFANGDMRKRIAHDQGLELHVPRRVNDGGMKVNRLSDGGIEVPQSWVPKDIVEMMIDRCKECDRENEKFDTFVEEFKSFTHNLEVHQLPHPSAVANALIVERNFKFNKKK